LPGRRSSITYSEKIWETMLDTLVVGYGRIRTHHLVWSPCRKIQDTSLPPFSQEGGNAEVVCRRSRSFISAGDCHFREGRVRALLGRLAPVPFRHPLSGEKIEDLRAEYSFNRSHSVSVEGGAFFTRRRDGNLFRTIRRAQKGCRTEHGFNQRGRAHGRTSGPKCRPPRHRLTKEFIKRLPGRERWSRALGPTIPATRS